MCKLAHRLQLRKARANPVTFDFFYRKLNFIYFFFRNNMFVHPKYCNRTLCLKQHKIFHENSYRSIENYKKIIFQYLIPEECVEAVILNSSFILHNFLSKSKFELCSNNASRLLFVILMISSKVTMDIHYNNKTWAHFFCISLKQLNQMEIEVILTLNWNVCSFTNFDL